MPEIYRVLLALIVALVAFSVTFFLVNRMSKPVPAIGSFSLDDTISDIKRELQRLEDTPGHNIGLELTEVKVSLFVQEEDTRSGNTGLTVPVFDEAVFGTSDTVTGQTGSKVTVVLVPPQGSEALSVDPGGGIEFANLLVAARQALHRSMDNEPKLEAKSIEVELAFALTAKRSDSASVKAKVISVGVTSDHKDTSSNTVTLTYLNPKYQKKDTGSGVAPP